MALRRPNTRSFWSWTADNVVHMDNASGFANAVREFLQNLSG